MPVLLPEPAVFPEGLLDGTLLPEFADRAWWVTHTRPRQEKALVRQLHDRQVPFYLPLIPRQFRLRGKIKTSYVPLFPGYAFVLASPDERLTALSTCRIVRFLRVPDQATLWQQLRQIERLITSGAPIRPDGCLTRGMTVKIQNGPLAGLRGKILRAASGRRFVVQIDFIQRGASVLLDDSTLVRTAEEDTAPAALAMSD